MFIHQKRRWPHFEWDHETLLEQLARVRFKQGRIVGTMETMGFQLKNETTLRTLTLEILKSNEIEGGSLDDQQVKSSIARKLGMDMENAVPADRNVEGVVDMMMDATSNYEAPLDKERLFGWQASLFPGGRSGMDHVTTGKWRDNPDDDPMQVVSGPMGKEQVHFQAPKAERLEAEMDGFLEWFNGEEAIDPVLKAGVAHFWFVTVHPFDDGNGRIARALTEMQLARADGSMQRFYSMSDQIRKEREDYYKVLERSQKSDLNITDWLTWFLECLERTLDSAEEGLNGVLKKARFWDKAAETPLNERQKQMLNKLLDDFEGKLTSSKWAKMNDCSQDTASRDIKDLMEKGLLKLGDAGGRSTHYLLQEPEELERK
jgi:Fic family protein